MSNQLVIKIVKATIVVLVAAFAAFTALSAFLTYREARARLNDLRELVLSKDPTASFELLKRTYGTRLHPAKGWTEGCTQRFCQYELSFSNRAISRFHLVPYTEMTTWFTVANGSLILAMVEYRVALDGPNSPAVHVQEGMCAKGCGVRFGVNPHGKTQQLWNGIVEFDTRATPRERNAALGLNLECFAKIGGCKNIIELLPTAWAQNRDGSISSRLMGLSQQAEESHGQPVSEDFW